MSRLCLPQRVGVESNRTVEVRHLRMDVSDPPTGVSDDRRLPATFRLEQNSANPFNLTTPISFELPAEALMTLTVYNTLGQEVATLVDGLQEAGFQSVSWDASDLPGGVYYVRMRAEEFLETRAMVLMK